MVAGDSPVHKLSSNFHESLKVIVHVEGLIMLLLVHGAVTASTAAADVVPGLNHCCYDIVTLLRLLRLQDRFRCCVVLETSMCRGARCCCCSTSTSLQCCLQLPDVGATATIADTRPKPTSFGTSVIDLPRQNEMLAHAVLLLLQISHGAKHELPRATSMEWDAC